MAGLGTGGASGLEPIADPRTSVANEGLEKELQLRQSVSAAPHGGKIYGIGARVMPGVTFEEYRHWAQVERAEEAENNRIYVAERGPMTLGKLIKGRFSKGVHHENAKKAEREAALQGSAEKGTAPVPKPGAPTEEEWKTAARALRTASWGTIFFLVTTDILGWSGFPYVFSNMGWGLGISMTIIFGIAAGIAGWMVWRVFLGLDSSRYPMMSFGDPFYRIYGKYTRHFINVMQAIQQFMTVAVLILGYGTTIAQLANKKICFAVCLLIFTLCGMALGSIRSLQRLGWLANCSVWLNIVSFIIIMYAAGNNPIDYEVVTSATLIKDIEPVRTFVQTPPDAYQQAQYGVNANLNGMNSLVYSYGGALLFIAFLAEMRHPMDFWKGMLMAQAFITFVYILFGAYVYSHLGQYSANNIANVIQPVALQTAINYIGLFTAFIACLLYFNIGMKTIYIEVFQEVFNFPTITTKKGRWIWYALGPIYWALAFVVAASVPNINGLVSVVGSLLILNFTYTFPAMLYLGYHVQSDAGLAGEGFDPATGVTTRHDTGLKRWVRGYTKKWYVSIACTVFFLGGLALSGMGAQAAIEVLISAFGPGGTVATSWGCAAPV